MICCELTNAMKPIFHFSVMLPVLEKDKGKVVPVLNQLSTTP
jgi:hypothetical protein